MAASSDNPLATPAAPRVHEQPFGDNKLTTPTGAPDTDANHYAFLDTDKETATDHADFRQYSNAQGRWMAPDPYDGSYAPYSPQSLDRYVYTLNSPLSAVDSSGMIPSLMICNTDQYGSKIYNCMSGQDPDNSVTVSAGLSWADLPDLVNRAYLYYYDPMDYSSNNDNAFYFEVPGAPTSGGSGGSPFLSTHICLTMCKVRLQMCVFAVQLSHSMDGALGSLDGPAGGVAQGATLPITVNGESAEEKEGKECISSFKNCQTNSCHVTWNQ